MGVSEIWREDVDLIFMTQDKHLWLVVNTVMNLRILPQKVGNFLTR